VEIASDGQINGRADVSLKLWDSAKVRARLDWNDMFASASDAANLFNI
jgi:hypothetical protein